MKLENIMLSGRSQTQMAHVLWFRLYEIFRKGESIKTGSKLVVVRGRGWGRVLEKGGPEMLEDKINEYHGCNSW